MHPENTETIIMRVTIFIDRLLFIRVELSSVKPTGYCYVPAKNFTRCICNIVPDATTLFSLEDG